MKKVMNKNKAIVIALMAIISVSFSNPVLAANNRNDLPGVEIKYLGFRDKNPVFEIIMNNPKNENFIITIRDESGTVLFSEKLSGKNLSRKYRIDTEEEITEGGLRFEVTSLTNKKTVTYLAGISENTTREMSVNKIQ
jgi:hypothetical protein